VHACTHTRQSPPPTIATRAERSRAPELRQGERALAGPWYYTCAHAARCLLPFSQSPATKRNHGRGARLAVAALPGRGRAVRAARAGGPSASSCAWRPAGARVELSDRRRWNTVSLPVCVCLTSRSVSFGRIYIVTRGTNTCGLSAC
jgi:hypothetical protein